MPRPRKHRRVHQQPVAFFYKPQGIPLRGIKDTVLSIDGLEAMRLADAEGMDQESSARMMGISRPTFSRLVAEARGIVARALVNGWAIRIEGGRYEMIDSPAAGSGPDQGRGRRHGGFGRKRRFDR